MASTLQMCYVRPGPVADSWLRETVAELKGADALQPVTVIVPNFYAGTHARWNLARHGGLVNVRTLRLAELPAQPPLTGLAPLSPVMEASAVRASLERAGSAFGAARGHHSLHTALISLFREVRRLEVEPDGEPGGSQHAVAGAALECYAAWKWLTSSYADPTEMREQASRRLAAATSCPAELADLGHLIYFLPTRVDPVDARLVAAAARWSSGGRAAFPWLDDPLGLGDQLARAGAALLARALGIDPPAPPATSPRIQFHADLRVLRAPDPAEEVREVIRQLIADLADVPLHRMAILYRQTDPYGPLVRESLDLAEIPWSALEGRALAESRPGRALVALVRMAERHFAREAVLEWVDLAGQYGTLEAAVWDRQSRAANVVRGAAQWVSRLDAFARERESDAIRWERDEQATTAAAARHEAEQARMMAHRMDELTRALRPPADGSPWSTFVTWAEELRVRFGAPADGWPATEEPFASALGDVLQSLRDADRIELSTGPTLGLFLDALDDMLRNTALPVGRLGTGVMLGPVQAVTGLTFDRVYLVGLTEGSFPPTPAADPFGDPVHGAARQRAADRQAFLTALATADGGRVTLSAPDSAGGREAFPSRWLLEVASVRAGLPVLHTASFKRLPESDWLRVVRSARAAVSGPISADLEDWRLQQAVTWTTRGRPLARHALARRPELALDRGLEVARARNSDDFTAYDGNLAALAASSRQIDRLFTERRPVSASAVETWAVCPFRYFLSYVLRVEPTSRPEDTWTIDPLERGSLVHGILEDFFRSLAEQGRPQRGEAYTEDDARLIEEKAREHFTRIVERGHAGHPLIWQNTQTAILADLRTFLAEDDTWRREHDATPRFFEQAFGIERAGAWPAVVIPVGGARLRFRGIIDRIDLDPSGRRAYVFDYKTGSATAYKDIARDPVLGGQHVQMAIYTRAVRGAQGESIPADGAYWFVSRRGEFTQAAVTDDAGVRRQRLEGVLGAIATGIRQGAFPQAPGEEDRGSFKSCRYCDFDRICPSARDDLYAHKLNAPGYRLHGSLTEDLPAEPIGVEAHAGTKPRPIRELSRD